LQSDLGNWSDELEALHEHAVESHFIDVWTRLAALAALRSAAVPHGGVVADLGCASGHLLRQVASERPDVLPVGVDAEAAGLSAAQRAVPRAVLAHASVTELPFGDGTVHAVVALNLLEHVPDDLLALREIARVLTPGGRAVLVVPANPRLYDYYDAYLLHERRYGRGELAGRAAAAGLRTISDTGLGALLYPGFWAVKRRNQLLHGHLDPETAAARVRSDVLRTSESRLGPLACRLERLLLRAGVRFPFGIRELLIAERPL
jgi:SAM-dependent methyltransferase